ncbi:MAG: InlB B-repeat-containing protein [Anaeroplasmataceae bacterium]|nr:InlB B-repeat-containing protein [Anaeroplasmataceae bacterium]
MKKFFAAIAFIFCLILVSCKTEATYKITYHDEGTITEILYSPNDVIPNKNILGSTKEGYELTAWYFDNQHTEIVTFPYAVTEDKDFWAEWTKLYTITLMNGTSTLKTEKVLDGKTLNNPGDPQMTGAGPFKGWSSSKDSYVPFDFTSPIHEDVTLYAFFEEPAFLKITISFMDGDTVIETKEIQENTAVSSVTAPSKDGYSFKGWSTKKDEFVEFNFDTKLTENTSLYAFYTKNVVTPDTVVVTFKDGETTLESKTIEKNSTITAVNAPSKEGYSFKGWSSNKDEFVQFDFESKVAQDTTLYAFYTKNTVTPNSVTVTFKDGETTLDSKTVEKNSAVSEITAPSKNGYTFKGWSTKKDEYDSYDFSNLVTNDLTLYAYYEIITYSITYKCNNETYTTQTVSINTSTDAPKAPSLAGYIFIEWCVDEECKTSFDFSTKITENITLYAKFEEVATHTLTLIVDGQQTQTQVNHNFTIDTVELPTKEGYEIKAWYTDKNYTNAFDVTTKITKDTTLYGSYTILSYTVILIDGSTSSENKVDYNSMIEFPTDPSKIGYTFKGWSTKQDEFVEFQKNTPVTKDLTLYAYYTINSFTVTFINEGSTIKSDTLEYNSSITLPETPTKTGHTFKGWSTSSTSYTAFDSTTKVTKDLTLYAFFDVISYTVTFIKDSAEYQKSTVEYNSTVTLPTAPSKTGHTFKGWSTSNTTYVAFDNTTKITSDITLYAHFDIQTFTVTFMDGNTKLSEETVEYNSTVAIPSNPTKAGWIFKGWSTNENTLVAFNFNTKITSNTTIYAYFVEEFTVTFNVDGTKTTTKVENGNKVPEPEAPTKSGYTFTGWYLDNTKFNFNTPITDSIELVAGFVSLQDAPIEITKYSGYNEGLFFEAAPVTGASLSDYSVQYKLATDSSWKSVDKQLIREQNNKIRCDIIGLPEGSYQVKIDVSGKTKTIACEVSSDDRSGYAHFNNTTGIGAYKNDGTLKSNAVVVYVTDATKNTVKATIGGKEYTGLVKIIQACTKESYALDIRILGEIQTTQWNFKEHGEGNTSTRQNNLEAAFNYVNDKTNWDESSSGNYSKLNAEDIISKGINSMSTDEANGITKLNGLTNQVLRNKKADSKTGAYEYDSYYNMLDVSKAYNITIEGIGTDAAIFQWGFAFKRCNSIEIKNLRFYNYTEDAVGFEGGSNTDKDYGNYWVHNCTFDIGVNNWDVCYENDKKDGDGSSDVKYCHNVTISYVQYNKTHKTNLIGSSDSALQYNITLHHNYYNNCGSRLPLVRQTNIHMYNNYYYKSTGYSNSIRANCYALVENCYYEAGQNPYETQSNGAIKAYNNVYDGVKLSSGSSYKSGNTVTSRTASVTNTCMPDGSTDYSDFDTNSTLFYYDSAKQASKVKNLLSPNDVPEHCKTYSGVLKSNITSSETPDPTPSGEYSITYVSAHGTTPAKVNNTSALPNPLPVLTETGWTFKGWYTKNTYEESSKAVAGAALTQNVTLYAKWEEVSENPSTNKITITFDSLATGTVTTITTSTGATLQKGNSSKDIKVAEASNTVNGTKLSKYVSVGGGGNYTDLSIAFTTTKKANITIYYANPGSKDDLRYIALYTADGLISQDATGAPSGGSIVSYTYANMAAGSYAATSKGSGLNIYMIVIEYVD